MNDSLQERSSAAISNQSSSCYPSLLLVRRFHEERPQKPDQPGLLMQTSTEAPNRRHKGPPLGILASIYTVLFISGLMPVTSFGGTPHFPGPWESADTIVTFFRERPSAALACASLQFGAAIPLGIYTATVVSLLIFHFESVSIRAAGPWIALFGGLMTAFNIMAASMVLWVTALPGMADDAPVLRALYYVAFAFGGPGFSVPMGLLIAGICIPALFLRLLPKWMVIFGLVIAAFGELSWVYFVLPQTLALIPLTRFPGFIWLIITGFMLSAKTTPKEKSFNAID